jgi:hypothetical protein
LKKRPPEQASVEQADAEGEGEAEAVLEEQVFCCPEGCRDNKEK